MALSSGAIRKSILEHGTGADRPQEGDMVGNYKLESHKSSYPTLTHALSIVQHIRSCCLFAWACVLGRGRHDITASTLQIWLQGVHAQGEAPHMLSLPSHWQFHSLP